MAARPLLPWHRRPLRRGLSTVQLGLAPDAPVLDGISSADLVVLRHLDGTHTRAALVGLAAHHDLPPHRVDELIALLDSHGVLVDNGPRRLTAWRRDHTKIVVAGQSPLVATLARSLGHADVGTVVVAPGAADDILAVVADDTSTIGCDRSLAVLVGAGAPDVGVADVLRMVGVAHLPVIGTGDHVTVGPLVTPSSSAGVCVRCVELHRADLDPYWPTVVDQTLGSTIAAAAAFSPGVIPLAVAVTVMTALSRVDGVSLPPGVTLELSAPWPRIDYRQWSAHPGCRCQHPAPPTAGRPRHHEEPLRETMAT
ncbi:MAG TPA: hypothetical protein PLL54_09530 [Dermatophilaceae bacterium]|nr:hypothetical protein [Dermatophilaceae bacterium]